MPVGALSKLSQSERKELVRRLHETQAGVCYICQEMVDLALHYDHLDIDHIQPLSSGGRDDVSNYALTHASCNRSKLATNLVVAQKLAQFKKLAEKCNAEKMRGPTLEELLERAGGGRGQLNLEVCEREVRYSMPSVGDAKVYTTPLYIDKLSGMRSFFAELPVSVLYHDERINPRSIGSNLRGLLEEFHAGRPQLHVSLGWVQTDGENAGRVHVFDGQHKAAAQILLGVSKLPIRVFIDPDLKIMLETNTNAGSKLRQVAFDKSALRNLGHNLYWERISQYQKDHGLPETDLSFSEEDLYKYFKGQASLIKRYIADDVRHRVIRDPDNLLLPYIELSGKSTDRPLSYSTIDRTFFSQYIHQAPLPTPIGADENPRGLEKDQLVRLMCIHAEELLRGRFDFEIGTHQIEAKAAAGEEIPGEHLAAVRLCREEVMHAWVALTKQVLESFLVAQGVPAALWADRLLHHEFPEQAWQNVRNFISSLRDLPCWRNSELSKTVFAGKTNYDYWKNVFTTGQSPQGVQVLAAPLNIVEMMSTQ